MILLFVFTGISSISPKAFIGDPMFLKFCRKVCHRGYIIEKGVIQYEGKMEEIWS
jgi:hypothetical protein